MRLVCPYVARDPKQLVPVIVPGVVPVPQSEAWNAVPTAVQRSMGAEEQMLWFLSTKQRTLGDWSRPPSRGRSPPLFGGLQGMPDSPGTSGEATLRV